MPGLPSAAKQQVSGREPSFGHPQASAASVTSMISSFRQGRSAPHQNCQSRFLRYLGRRDELALWSAYELGREGLSGGLSLLDVVQIHHRVPSTS